ncbi:GNAT family N-acetyltransferase [Thermaurantiacus sp.]
MIIRPRQPEDQSAIAELIGRCFPAPRRQRTAELLRGQSKPLAGLAFVAAADGCILGSVACHPVQWKGPDGSARPLVLLGPLVSDPRRRGEGIGLRLMARAVAALDRVGADSMLIGDQPYYGRFGYRADATAGWRLPGPVEPERLLLRARDPAIWAGPAIVLPAASAANGCGVRLRAA